MFNRTVAGLINKFLFYPSPIIWVEGKDDFPFYQPILHQLGCRIEAAGGKDECKKLAESIIEHNYPFVVILDGDYEILENRANPHKRILVLNKYSIENYLFEKVLVQSVCCKYGGGGEKKEEMGVLFDEVEREIQQHLINLVILDIANYKQDAGLKAFSDRADSIFDKITIRCLPERISTICGTLSGNLSADAVNEARGLVENFLQTGKFSDLLKGHVIFGILRHLIHRGVQIIRNNPPYIDNDSLLIMLSLELWNIKPSEHHLSLETNIRIAAEEAFQIKSIQ
jgi:hypothetical protein